jgi:malate dehydrogenase (oxaloacetate-decarboxylating)
MGAGGGAPGGSIEPSQLRDVAAHIATAVGREAQRAGVAPKTSDSELRQRVAATQWTPAYPSFTS